MNELREKLDMLEEWWKSTESKENKSKHNVKCKLKAEGNIASNNQQKGEENHEPTCRMQKVRKQHRQKEEVRHDPQKLKI